MKTLTHATAAAIAALAFAQAQANAQAPSRLLSADGGYGDVVVEPSGLSLVIWSEQENATQPVKIHFCKVAVGAVGCDAGSERVLTSGTWDERRAFLLRGPGQRVVIVQGGCCDPVDGSYRWVSEDLGATFSGPTHFASMYAHSEGLALGPGDAVSIVGDPDGDGTVGFQQANLGGYTTSEATLDSAPGLVYAQAAAIDPATGKPVVMYTSNTDAFATFPKSGGDLNSAATWTLPSPKLTGVTNASLATNASKLYATWIRDVQHEVARWNGTSFDPAVALPFTPGDNGEADIDVDPAGGVHVVWSPPGKGKVCYAFSPDGTTFQAPRQLGGHPDGVGDLELSAQGVNGGRVMFSRSPAQLDGVLTIELVPGTETPNLCGLAPSGLSIAKGAGADVDVAVQTNGQDTSWHVEYGKTSDLGAKTAAVAVPGSGTPATGKATLAGLSAGATYFARLVATNATGTTTSDSITFTVPKAPRALKTSDLVKFSSRCKARRTTISIVKRPDAPLASVRITATGRKAVTLRGSRIRRKVVITKLRRRAAKVTVTLKLKDGRVLKTTKTFKRCH